MSYLKIGVAGPVGSGKTALIEALTRRMAKGLSIGVITNDIYTKEDAQFLSGLVGQDFRTDKAVDPILPFRKLDAFVFVDDDLRAPETLGLGAIRQFLALEKEHPVAVLPAKPAYRKRPHGTTVRTAKLKAIHGKKTIGVIGERKDFQFPP